MDIMGDERFGYVTVAHGGRRLFARKMTDWGAEWMTRRRYRI